MKSIYSQYFIVTIKMMYDFTAICHTWATQRDRARHFIQILWRQLEAYQASSECHAEEAARYHEDEMNGSCPAHLHSDYQLHRSYARSYRRRAIVTWMLLSITIRWWLMEGLMSLQEMDDQDPERRQWLAERNFSTGDINFSLPELPDPE